jgi:hypothetical protein
MTLFDNRHQIATLWTVNGVNAAGDPSFASPSEITVRWDERSVVYTDRDGEEKRSSAVVDLGQDVKIGDWLFLGTSIASDPSTVVGAYPVQSFEKSPTVSGDAYVRTAYL